MKITKLANRRMKKSIQEHRITPRTPAEELERARRIAKAVAYLQAHREQYRANVARAGENFKEPENGILAGQISKQRRHRERAK